MKILLTTDGSESARSAIDYTLGLPLPAGCEFILMTVIEKDLYKSKKKADLTPEQLELLQQTKRMLQDEAEELIQTGSARLETAGVRYSTLIRSGHPSREIVRVAKKQAVDLIVVGSHGLGGIKRFLLGSVSDKVLAYAPCSVLIVKSSAERPGLAAPGPQSADESGTRPLRLLLAYDDSPPARQAVDLCAALNLDERTEIIVLTILPVMKLYRQDIKQQLSWVWKERKKSAQKSLERLATEVDWSTPHVTTQLHEAEDVSQEILHIAEASGVNLILLGHKGKGAIQKFLLGSVTTRIAHHAPCSVWAVREQQQKT